MVTTVIIDSSVWFGLAEPVRKDAAAARLPSPAGAVWRRARVG